jgi:hypothetical protein
MITLGFSLFVMSYFIFGKNTLNIGISQANASISFENDALISFPNGQKRHIRRAVISEPKNLLKLHGFSVMAALDKPEIIRKDLPAVVWQYRHNACVLDIYFNTKNDKAEHAAVVHYEMRSRTADASHDAPDEKACLRDIIENGAETQMVGVSAFYKSYIQ